MGTSTKIESFSGADEVGLDDHPAAGLGESAGAIPVGSNVDFPAIAVSNNQVSQLTASVGIDRNSNFLILFWNPRTHYGLAAVADVQNGVTV